MKLCTVLRISLYELKSIIDRRAIVVSRLTLLSLAFSRLALHASREDCSTEKSERNHPFSELVKKYGAHPLAVRSKGTTTLSSLGTIVVFVILSFCVSNFVWRHFFRIWMKKQLAESISRTKLRP